MVRNYIDEFLSFHFMLFSLPPIKLFKFFWNCFKRGPIYSTSPFRSFRIYIFTQHERSSFSFGSNNLFRSKYSKKKKFNKRISSKIILATRHIIEIDKILKEIHVLTSTIKLKKIWKQHNQYIKLMWFLPSKKKEKKTGIICVMYVVIT